MNNTGKLTTPSGEGASIEVYENNTCDINAIIEKDLIFSHGRIKNKISTNTGLKEFQMLTGETYNDGAWFSLRTQDEINGDYIGSFNLGVRNIYTGESIAFKGYPNTSLRWGEWDIECVNTNKNSNGIYRVHKNGLIEQYGSFSITTLPATTSVAFTISLPTTMSSTNYTLLLQMNGISNNWSNIISTIETKTTTYFKALIRNTSSVSISDIKSIFFNYYIFGS